MSEKILSLSEIESAVKQLLAKYHAESALLFGSYARGEATKASDIDLVVFGGSAFRPTDIFAIAEELSELISKPVDVYEIREIDRSTPFFENVIREGVRIAA